MSEQENNESGGQDKDDGPKRASLRTRAYRIRKKVSSGKARQDEIDWLSTWDATKQQVGSPEPAEPDEPELQDVDAAESPTVDEPMPPPPRITVDHIPGKTHDTHGSGGGDWRKKYAKGTTDGRERTVTAIASQMLAALTAISDQIKMAGEVPLVDPQALWPHLVITVDDLLPERVRLKPSHIVVGATAVLVGQRIKHHRKIVAVYEGRAATGDTPAATPPPPPPQPPEPGADAAPPESPAAPDPVYNDTPPPPPPLLAVSLDVGVPSPDVW